VRKLESNLVAIMHQRIAIIKGNRSLSFTVRKYPLFFSSYVLLIPSIINVRTVRTVNIVLPLRAPLQKCFMQNDEPHHHGITINAFECKAFDGIIMTASVPLLLNANNY